MQADGITNPTEKTGVDNTHAGTLESDAADRLEQHDVASLQLDRELDSILILVQSYLDSSVKYSGSLDNTIKNLSSASELGQVTNAVKLLIAENMKMKSDTANLTNNLEQSKAQVTEMREKLTKSRERERRDPLTNMGNRRWFDICMAREFQAAASSNAQLCLVMMDIDHFKQINDKFGHPIGDEILKYVAALLQDSFKGKDTTARYGGEEFVIILPSTSLHDARIIIDQLRAKLEGANLVISENQVSLGTITASFGIAKIRKSDTLQDLVKRADGELYRAKEAGRNCVVCENGAIKNAKNAAA